MKTLRYIGIIFAVLLILTSVVACGGQTDPDPLKGNDEEPNPSKGNDEEEPDPSQGNEEPKEITVTFDIPEGWTLSDPIPNSFMTQVEHSSGANLNIQKSWRAGSALEEHVDKTKTALDDAFKIVEWHDDRSLKIDGHDAIELNFTYTVAGFDMVLKATYLEIDGTIYGITFTCFAKDADSMVQDYQTIIDTAKFE